MMIIVNGMTIPDEATHYAIGRVYGIYYKIDKRWFYTDGKGAMIEACRVTKGLDRNGPFGRGDNPVIELPR